MADGVNDAVADLHARFQVAVGDGKTLVEPSQGDKTGHGCRAGGLGRLESGARCSRR